MILGGVFSIKSLLNKNKVIYFRPFTPPSPRRLHITVCHRTFSYWSAAMERRKYFWLLSVKIITWTVHNHQKVEHHKSLNTTGHFTQQWLTKDSANDCGSCLCVWPKHHVNKQGSLFYKGRLWHLYIRKINAIHLLCAIQVYGNHTMSRYLAKNR